MLEWLGNGELDCTEDDKWLLKGVAEELVVCELLVSEVE